jgi:esterase FrsA
MCIALRRSALVAGVMISLAASSVALAQIAPPRTLEELKAETQARADRNAYPLTGLKAEDVRKALANINSLDRDEWADAWGKVAAPYALAGKAAEAVGRIKEAQENYLMAWRLYSFARWPTENSPGKQKAYGIALAAFQNYARHLDPPLETVRIPFEGKEIVGLLRLPKGVRPAPLVLSISALDSRKEEHVERGEAFLQRGIATFALDMPGTGQAPLRGEPDAERMFSRALDYLATRPDIDAKRVVVQGGSWSGHFGQARHRGARAPQGRGRARRARPLLLPAGLADQGARHARISVRPVPGAGLGLRGCDARRISRLWAAHVAEGTGTYRPARGAPMLLGDGDSQVPIADLDLLLHAGSPKEAWVNPGGGHMGRSADWPDGRIYREVVAPWIARQISD